MKRFWLILTSLAFCLLPHSPGYCLHMSMGTDHYAQELETYYQKARPEIIAPALAAMARDGSLERNDRRLFMAAFLAQLLRNKKLDYARLAKICDFPGNAGISLQAWAIHLAALPNNEKILAKLLANNNTLLSQLRNTPAPLEKLNPAWEKSVLQMYWAAFFATGNIAWLDKIIDTAIEWEHARKQGIRTSPAGSEAAASLFEFAPRHEIVRKTMQKRLDHAPLDTHEMLNIILNQKRR